MPLEPKDFMIMTVYELLFLGGLLAIFYFIYRFFYAPYQVLKRCGIKGPTPVPFFGNYREISKMKEYVYYEYLVQEYGPISGYYLGQQPRILITDLDMLKEIMVKDFNSFTDRTYFPDLLRKKPSHLRGLFSSFGEHWRFSRRILSPTFSTSKIKMMEPLVSKSVATLVDTFAEGAASGKSIDVVRPYGSFAMETILATAFGRVIDIQRGESDELTRAVDSTFRSFQEGGSLDRTALTFLLSNFPWMVSLLQFFATRSKRGEQFALLEDTSLHLVKDRRKSKQPGKYKDLLQLMIDASEGDEDGDHDIGEDTHKPPDIKPSVKKSNNGRKLTDEEIVAHAVTFMLAGYETTASTLACTSYLLALNPDIQEKLQSEIDSYFDDKPEASSYEASQTITYLDNVIQESLRLYPVLPRISRECRETTVIKGITIPKGATVMIPAYLLQIDPQYWKDPQKFNPDRFSKEERAKRPQLCHMPFGFGPRNCIGMRFALLEVKVALMELLRKYTFVRAPDTEVPLQTVLGITMAPKNGVYLKIVNR